MLRYGDVVRHRPMATVVVAGDSQHAAVVAQADIAPTTVEAAAAVDGRVKVTRSPTVQPETSIPSCAITRRLVPHDQRRLPPARAAVHAVDIAAADSACRDADENLVRADLRLGNILKLEVIVACQNQSFQQVFSVQGRPRQRSRQRWTHGEWTGYVDAPA